MFGMAAAVWAEDWHKCQGIEIFILTYELCFRWIDVVQRLGGGNIFSQEPNLTPNHGLSQQIKDEW
jgi:hypothetical protein